MRKMYKKAPALLLCLMLLLPFFGGTAHAYGAIHGIFIRIGLESHFLEQSQITIHSNALEVGSFTHGFFHVSGFLFSDSGFVAQPTNAAFVRLNYSLPSLAHAQAAAALHPNAAPALLEDGFWGVFIPAGFDDAALTSTRRVVLSADGQIVLVSENINQNLQIRDVSGITALGARQYRGIIELARFRGQNLTAVNIIELEEYLWSVVPAEMPPSWHSEALKAQAVAARTFAVRRLGAFAERGYDVCDTTMSQVYLGVSNEDERTTAAVNATRGTMIFHNNQPIEAVYFSSSGGVTENSEDVWGSYRAYLRSVADVHETTGREWSRNVTQSQLAQMLSQRGISIGSVTGVRVNVMANGRVLDFTILGTNGSHTLSREYIRWFFSPSLESRNFTIAGGATSGPPADAQGAHVLGLGLVTPAQLAQMSIVSATGVFGFGTQTVTVLGATGSGTIGGETGQQPHAAGTLYTTAYQFTLTGRGWGHGVGMSQHGAHGMALAGFNYRQILHFYYTGVEIR